MAPEEVMLLDWLCYQFVRWFPVWKLNPKGRIYGGFILPRCGNWIYRDWQRERDLERRVAELEEDNRRLREAIRKADRRLDDLASVPLGPAAAVVAEAHLYLKGAIRQSAPEGERSKG